MEIEILANKVRINTSQDIGSVFIAAGLARPVVIATPKFQDMHWAVSRGPVIGDEEAPPFIAFNCRSCGQSGKGNPAPNRLDQQNIRCCGGVSNPPRHIANEYLELRKDYLKRRGR